MRANTGFDQPSPMLPVVPGLDERAAVLGAHQSGVQHLKFGAGTALAQLAVIILGQPRQHPRASQQLQVMGQRGGVSRVRKLPKHLLIRKDLAGIGATKLEQAAQQRRFVHAGQKQDVPRKRGLDQRIQNVTPPAFRLAHQARGARIGTVENVVLQTPAERLAHVRERPVRHGNHLKTSGKAFGQAALDEQRRRTEQNHFQGNAGVAVLVPKQLYDRRPMGDFLNLVQNQQRTGFVLPGLDPGNIPLLFNPSAVAQGWLVGGCVTGGYFGRLHYLPNHSGLAHLSGASQYLHKTALFLEPFQQFVMDGLSYHAVISTC